MQGLMLHCGAEAIDRKGLERLPTPDPRGRYHVTRPFIEDVELVSEQLQANDLTIQEESFGVLYKDDMPAKFFGLIQVGYTGFDKTADYGLLIGLRGSYDASFSRALAVGSRVFVCDNLAFSGEIEIKTRQTINIGKRLPAMFERAVSHIPDMFMRQDRRFQVYRETEFTRERGDALLTDFVRRGVMAPSQLGKALKEWDEPSHEQHTHDGLSAWRMHNAVTEAIKPANQGRNVVPMVWHRTRRLTDALDEAVELPAAA